MNQAERFAVILKRHDQRDPLAVAKALAALRKTPLQDQISAAKKGWGIIAQDIVAEEANVLVEGLAACGLESLCLPTASLIQLPPAEPARRFEAALANHLVLVCAAGITVTSTTTKTTQEGPSAAQKILSTGILLTTGLPIRIGGKTRAVEKTQQHSDLAFYLDLLYEQPLRRRRIDAQHFDYAYLKERKLYYVLGNFKQLVGDLVQSAPEAWRNHGARVLLDNKPMQTMGYESLADMERETRWLLTHQARETGRSL